VALLRDIAADGELAHVFEGAERFCDEVAFAVADFAFAIRHGGRAVQHAGKCAEFTAARLHEVDFHFDGDHADAVVSETARGHREGDVGEGHGYAAVCNAPGVHVRGGQRQQYFACAIFGADELHAE
jgi:hypothetical protein